MPLRCAAVRALGDQSDSSESTITALTGLLSDENSHVRSYAVDALSKRPNLSESTVAELTGLLSDQDPDVRSIAIGALGKQLTLSESSVPALQWWLSDGDLDVRSIAIAALDRQPNLPVSSLITLLTHPADHTDFALNDILAYLIQYQALCKKPSLLSDSCPCQTTWPRIQGRFSCKPQSFPTSFSSESAL